MKLYRVDYSDLNEGVCLSWHPSKADALRFVRTVIDEGPSYSMADFRIEPAEVPTQKIALIDWLNENLARDNG